MVEHLTLPWAISRGQFSHAGGMMPPDLTVGVRQHRMYKIGGFLIALFQDQRLKRRMDRPNRQDFSRPTPLTRVAAFSVHIFTALGAGVGLIALLEAVREHWAAMFWWLGVALVIDGVDGPLARRLDVGRVQPNWSGEVLDLVVDYITYVFVPAYAIAASGLLLPSAAPILGVAIAVTGVLYFADRRMKSADNHFRGFPGLWNIAALYLFILHLPPVLSTLGVTLLIVLTFVPFNVIHPVRVARLRWLTLSLIGAWAALVMVALTNDFEVGTAVKVVLCLIGLYIVGCDAAIRFVRSLNT
jgi:phosphatidylcholine synthase